MRIISTVAMIGVVLAVALMTSAIPVSAMPGQQPLGMPFGDDAPEVGLSSDGEMTQQQMQDRVRNMSQTALEKRMFGPLDYEGGIVDGGFIRFSYNDTTGELNEYSVRVADGYEEMFQSVNIVSFTPEDHVVAGSVFAQWNTTHRMVAHNNPTSMIKTQSNGTDTVTSFLLNNSFSVETLNRSGDGEAVRITSEDVHAVISVGNGSIVMDNGSAGTYVNATAVEGATIFRMTPYFSEGEHGQRVCDAVAEGRISNEISVMARNGDVLTVENSYNNNYSIRFREMAQNRFSFEVSSNLSQGKVMILIFDNVTLDASSGIDVELDDDEISAGDVDDVLNATGSQGIYTLIEENGTNYVLAYIPQFSTHILSVESSSADDGGDICFGIFAIAGVGLLAIPLTLMRGRP